VFAALGDPTRLGIVELLAVQDLSPDALAAALEIPGNLLAHHLKVLDAAGLIVRVPSQKDRRRTYVRVEREALEGLIPVAPRFSAPRVLFVCTHNSARSVLAEALWREASEVPTSSAGTHPADQINPKTRRVAGREHLILKQTEPRSLTDVLRPDDLVVSVCDAVNEELGELDNLHLHWSIPDPAAIGNDAAFTTAVADIRERVSHLAPRVSRRRGSSPRKAHR
jgi:protein-tyrosine-phosphatase